VYQVVRGHPVSERLEDRFSATGTTRSPFGRALTVASDTMVRWATKRPGEEKMKITTVF
jgi:hypothetical protein